MTDPSNRTADVARIGGVRPEFMDAVDRAMRAAGASDEACARVAGPLAVACKRFGITTVLRLAHFAAQLGHESGGFARLEENLNYTPDRLRAVWPARFGTNADAAPYAGNPEALANLVYAGVNGNVGIASGDGWRYRGRGLIQLTGRSNYRAAGRALEQPLEAEPDRAAEPWTAALVAGWYWQTRGLNLEADKGLAGVGEVTRLINGRARHGLADRTARLERAIEALAPFPDQLEA